MVGSMSPTELSPTGHAASDRVGPVHNSVAPLLQGPFWARLAPTGSILAAAIAVTIRDPHSPGSWGVCPTYAIFGVYCPGCGSLRGLHDLAAGNWFESVGHNALVVPGILFVAYSAVGRPGRWWSYLWLAAFITFTIARNLPNSPTRPVDDHGGSLGMGQLSLVRTSPPT